ncbi:DUF3443 domain-containing protein [Georgfuchsia toluolica]|nr:DUF3443 domain-containing protein [Georgfuchsia toluolica]
MKVAAIAACLLLVSCGGGGGGGGGSTTIANPVIVSIGANPTALTAGQSTMLTWSSSNATACQASSIPASGEWGGAVALSGSKLVTPPAAGSFTYTLTCNGTTKSVVVAVSNAPALPTVSMSLAPASVSTGQPATLTWSTTNATSCNASSDPPGTWTGSQGLSGSTTVTQAVAGTYTYTLTCNNGSGGSASGSVTLGVTGLAGNVTPVYIDSGPAGASNIINVPFVSVTLCRPGTSTCQTIDHVLVDTASFGLRIIAGVLDPALALPAITASDGSPMGECAQFVSGFMWGSVHSADVKIADEIAPSLPVQEVGDTAAAFANIPCSGANFGTVARLGANGILGVGLFNQDCGSACATQTANGVYYKCIASTSTCTGTRMPLASQVANPVPAFASDNNGVVLTMPAVAAGGATTLIGTLTFGIDTQSNNNVGSATVYAADPHTGNFTTTYKGVNLTSSFLDSGSNGYFFADAVIPACSAQSGFYCPPTPLALSAVNTSANGAASGTVDFTIVNLQALDASIRAASVGGNIGQSGGFDWGMPFFFGRTVFVAIAGRSTSHGTGPYWAY